MTSNEQRARRMAERFRADHGLGTAPIKDVFELVHTTQNIDVMSMAADETEHGLTMMDPATNRTVIAVATTGHPMRLRSSVAHELGHILAGDLGRDVILIPGERNPAEIRADAFARHLLLPLDAVRVRFTRGAMLTLQDLSHLVQEYEVSPHLAAIQLRETKLITPEVCAEWRDVSTRALATSHGWLSQYRALASDASTPRAPQALMSRAVEGYHQGLVDIHEVARWYGEDAQALREALGDVEEPADEDDWGLDTPLFPDPGGAANS